MAKSSKKNLFLKILLGFLVVILLIIGLGLIVVGPYLSMISSCRSAAMQIARKSTSSDFRTTQTSIVYDINGDVLTTFSGAVDLYYVTSDKIPQVIKDGFVVEEDRRFYSHNGIDLKSIIRSVVANMENNDIVQGASTITQQLARNVYLSQEVTYERKFTEIFLSLALEKRYNKNQILEYYLNNIYFGHGYYGIAAAAKGYFSKELSELTISEMAFLVGIPNNPSKFDPVTHMDKAIARRNVILDELKAYNKIDEFDYYYAKAEDVVLKRPDNEKNDYVETYIFYCATRALMARNGFEFRYYYENEEDEQNYYDAYDYYYSQYQSSLFTNGYRIYTAIDPEKQEWLQTCVNDALSVFIEKNDEGVYKMQASAVCIDNSYGYVTAIVGGRDQNFPGYTLNRAYQSYRQSGSSIKPLNVYVPFLMEGHNPDYIVDDSPLPGGPENFEGLYLGDTTITEALAWSSNVATWRLYEELTPEYGMSFLHKLHFKKLGNDDKYMATCLGGFTYGVSAVEMAAGFATLENDGIYRDPTCIKRITDASANTIVDNMYRDEPIYDKTATRMISKMLQYGVEQGIASFAALDNAVVAVKTGTTSDNKDGWTVGYSRYYTTAVWVGCDIPEVVEDLTGGTYPMTIWHSFMEEIHNGLDKLEFPDYVRFNDRSPHYYQDTGSGSYGGSGGGYHDGYDYSDGDQNANITDGDRDAVGEGDRDANITGGDKDATGEGDRDANITGGDRDAVGEGDRDANTTGGDRDAAGEGDRDANVDGGDQDANTAGGDQDANITGGDRDAR